MMRGMGFFRTVCALVAASAGIFYLTSASSLSSDGKWSLIGVTFVASLMWVLLGGRGVKNNSRNRAETSTDATPEQDSEVELEPSDGADIPAPVIEEENLDGVSLRERKLAKIQAANQPEEDDSEVQETIVEVEVTVENVHTADEYVVEVSPESVEDADIEMTVSNRRVKHQEIRQRIEKRRRNQLAEIRASTVRMWEQYNEGEDIVALLQNPEHGLTVVDEPQKPEAGHVYGATFIRLDEATILKLRTPLDSGFEEVEKKSSPEGLPDLGNMPLPPLPDGNMPLPPLPNASDALAAMKLQIDED
ncbi:MAG TPA: hypothetical protein HA327_02835 [Candidatus Poseidoniaceae archaeon]|nr:hypothetical protein [Candidatus Poseidoniaceae archaeon]|tara:strand:+ start:749 stop:1663 length:915 start_codon:yes stop_codon:yes gene_type:complete